MANKQEPNRRNDVIRCEKCGEYYSVTYKRCPFCDERPVPPGRKPGGKGRRVAGQPGSYGKKVNPLQIIALVCSLALIIAALYIVFNAVAPLLGHRDDPSSSQTSSSTDISAPVEPVVPEPVEPPAPPAPVINSITLNKTDFTLGANEFYTIEATIEPASEDAVIIWETDKPDAIYVSENGTVTNINTGASQVKTTVTATCGDKSAECTVYCRGGSTGVKPQPQPQQPGGNGQQPSGGGQTGAGSVGVITNAGNGLNIRKGPGSSYEAFASLPNDTVVTILEDTGSGWYKISFIGLGGKVTEGYGSKDYISAR